MAHALVDAIRNFFVENQHQINDYDTHVAILDNLREVDFRANSIKPIAALLRVKLRQCLEILRKAFRPEINDEAVRHDACLAATTVCKQLILLCRRRPDFPVRTFSHAHSCDPRVIIFSFSNKWMQQQLALSCMTLHAYHYVCNTQVGTNVQPSQYRCSSFDHLLTVGGLALT